MNSANVSVVIPTWNAGKEFRAVLDAVMAQSVKPELVIIDSDSTDGTAELAQSYPARLLRTTTREFNHGATRNEAARAARGEFIAFLTQDARPADERWLEELTAPFDDASVAGTYSRVVPRADASPLVERSVKADLVYDTTPLRKHIAAEDWERTSPFERRVRGHFNNVSSCVRRSVFERVSFPRIDFGEDLAWGVRMLELGYTIAYQPSSVVVHSHATHLAEDYRRHRADAMLMHRLFGFRNRPSFKSALLAYLGEVRKDLRYVACEDCHHRLHYALVSPIVRAVQIAGQCAGSRGARPSPPEWSHGMERP
jgi:rhamnosyltransferase